VLEVPDGVKAASHVGSLITEIGQFQHWGIVVAIGMALMALIKSFGYDARRLEDAEKKSDTTADLLSAHVDECSKRREEYGALKQKVESVDAKVDRMDSKLDRLLER
jgi:hypothetical protein